MDNKPTASEFSSLAVTPIASLFPDIGSPGERYLHAVVILLWPFSSATKQFVLLLSEPDPRLRGGKGQIKAVFRYGAAEAVAKSSIGIGDTVYLSLQGAKWKSSGHADSGQLEYSQWELIFSNRVFLEAQRNSIPLSIVNFKIDSHEVTTEGSTELPVTPKRLSAGFSSPISTINRSWASPAFSRGSNTLFSSPLLDGQIEEDGYIPGKGRKRTKFSRPSNDWVYVDSAPSPTKEGDMWDDEDLEANVSSPDEVLGERGIEAPQPPSETLPLTKENVEVYESEAQKLVAVHDSESTFNGGSPIPRISKPQDITQIIQHGIALQPAAECKRAVLDKQPLFPDIPGIQSPQLHPAIPPDTPTIPPPGTSVETSSHNSIVFVDSTDKEFSLINEGPVIQGVAEASLHIGNDEKGAFDPGAKAKLSDDTSKREYRVPSDRATDLPPELDSYSGHSSKSTSAGTDSSPENMTENAISHHGNSEPVNIENIEVLSTDSDSSSVNSADEERNTVRHSQAGLEVYKSGGSSTKRSTPDAENLERTLSLESDSQPSVSSDVDISSDDGSDNVSLIPSATEPNKPEIYVISDDESEASESEAESITERQMSNNICSSISSDRKPSSRSPTFYIEKSTLDEPAGGATHREIIGTQTSSSTPNTNAEHHSSLPPGSHDDSAADNEMHAFTEDQDMSISFPPTVPDIHPTAESDFSHHGLHHYLSDAICHPGTSHIPTDLAVHAGHPREPHGEELMSHFLEPQPTDLRAPENTQVSWTPLNPEPRIHPFPVHLDPSLPTPEDSQSTEHIHPSIPGVDDQIDASHPSHSYTLPEHPSISRPDPVEAEGTKGTQVQTHVTEAIDHQRDKESEVTHQDPSSDHVTIEPASESNTDLETFGLRTQFSYFCPLSRLVENFNQLVDCIAIVVDITPINRAAKGVKEYYISLRLTDKSSGGSTTTAQIFHKKKDALPVPAEGDTILLRNFRVQSLNHMMVLNNMENSAWAFFPQEGEVDVQVDDAPVEFGSEEQDFAAHLGEWYKQEGAELVVRNASRANQRESIGISSRSASEAGSQLRNIVRKRRRESRITYHELRDGKRYADVGSPSDNETIHELRNGTLYAHPS